MTATERAKNWQHYRLIQSWAIAQDRTRLTLILTLTLTLTLTLILIQPALGRTPMSFLSVEGSSQLSPILHRSISTTPFQFVLGRPGFLLKPEPPRIVVCAGGSSLSDDHKNGWNAITEEALDSNRHWVQETSRRRRQWWREVTAWLVLY